MENEIFCIFDVSEFDAKSISQLCKRASELVGEGFIFQTSGTTGVRKFVLHDFDSIFCSGLNINRWSNVNSKDIFISPISLFHMGGFSVLARAIIANADEATILDSWSLSEFIRLIEESSATTTSLVPSLIYQIVQSKQICPKTLKVVYVGGAPLSLELYESALKLKWPLVRTFGSSEACSQIFTQYDVLDNKLYLLPHWEVKTDSEDYLLIKGLALFKGYLTLADSAVSYSPVCLDSAGFFKTEDRIKLKPTAGEDEQLDYSITDQAVVKRRPPFSIQTFLGRANDLIKVNASLVNLSELRSEFHDFCLVDQISPEHNFISAQKDLKGGYRLVVNSDQVSNLLASKIRLWNKDRPSEKRISGIYFIDEISKTELGKVKYSNLF